MKDLTRAFGKEAEPMNSGQIYIGHTHKECDCEKITVERGFKVIACCKRADTLGVPMSEIVVQKEDVYHVCRVATEDVSEMEHYGCVIVETKSIAMCQVDAYVASHIN